MSLPLVLLLQKMVQVPRILRDLSLSVFMKEVSQFSLLYEGAVHQLGLGFCFLWCPLIMLNVCCICWFSFFPLGLRCCSLLLIIGFKHVRILIKVLVMILKFYTFVLHASL